MSTVTMLITIEETDLLLVQMLFERLNIPYKIIKEENNTSENQSSEPIVQYINTNTDRLVVISEEYYNKLLQK